MSVYDEEKAGDNIIYVLIKRLKIEMRTKKISMTQLSKDSGVSIATVSRILNEQTYPKFGTLFQLFCAIDIELDISGWSKEDGEELF